MLSPFAASNIGSIQGQLHPQSQSQPQPQPQPQPQQQQQLKCSSKSGFNLQSGAYPALSSRASKLLNADVSRYNDGLFPGLSQPFGSSASLNVDNNSLFNDKISNYGSYVPSDTLSSTDLQFSGYILNGSNDINRNSYTYVGPSVCAATAFDGSTGNFKMLGTSDAHTLSNRHVGERLSAAGTPTVTSTPYHGYSSVGTMPMMRYNSCNSYTSLLNKANLLFDNNLESMTVGWTLEERECRRRLVQFWRRHENNSIMCTFKAVSVADRVPNIPVVSCIFWEEKQDFFITSVDCIQLLESLIAVRFTVEEKNRIRRNLEGFRPLTVSKCKTESTGFFKLIMSYPNPKPRNIEKDVKVFPWRILPLALKKIISKYTASYDNPTSAPLDALTTTKASGSSHLAGISLSAPSGGMMAFSPNTPSVLTSPSTMSDAIAAAANNSTGVPTRWSSCGNTFASAGTQASTPSPASGSTSKLSSTTSLAAILEAQGACNEAKSRVDARRVSSTYTTCPQPGTGMCFDLGLGMGINYKDLGAVGTTTPTAAPPPFGNNSLLGYGQLVSTTDYEKSLNAYTPSFLHDQNQTLQQDYQHSSFKLKQGGNQQLCPAGMASDPSLQLSTSTAPEQRNGTAAHFLNGNIFEQLDGYGISSLDCGSQFAGTVDDHGGVNPQVNIQSQLQLAVRGSSTKRSVHHMPYKIERSERIKPGSASSDCGSKATTHSDLLSRVSTSLSSTCDNSSVRAVSPSIPLIMEQQTTSNAAEAVSFNSFLDFDAAADPSSTPTTLSRSVISSTESLSADNDRSLVASTGEFIGSKAASVPFHDMLGKAFYSPSHLQDASNGSSLQIEDTYNANMPGLPIGNGISSDDYTFLADLIRVSTRNAAGNHVNASPSDSAAYSTSTEIKNGKPSATAKMADTFSDHESAKNPSASVGGLVEQLFSPHIALAKNAAQLTTGLKAGRISTGDEPSAHGLESPTIFNTILFGDAKSSHRF
ncbi:hypothetical protein H4R24_001165 [Coemansia sp. RSA 988]|nr:hypothetical protein H4R24_001165 [Coemansia sp. RSA 988]